MMIALWIMIVILSLLAATVGALIALRIQYRTLEEGRQERDAWREAQEGRQRTWEVRQAKRNLEVEKQLSNQVKDLRREWQGWQQDWHEQTEQDQQHMLARADLEQELARLPHIEDVELPFNAQAPRQQPERWQPPALYQANLRGRDLSHRYMGRADLREAQMAGANLYMADLTGASMAGANLEGANLAGANLTGADLRRANLRGANLLVADLHSAILHGATLLETRGLSAQQLQTAIYDSTTLIDNAKDTALAASPADKEARSAISEPAENETTQRMPVLKKTTQREAAVAKTEAVTPAASEAGQALTSEPGTQNTPEQDVEEQEEASAEEEELPSNKIIQLLTRSVKKEQPSETKKTGGKKKGSKISSISQNKDTQTKAN